MGKYKTITKRIIMVEDIEHINKKSKFKMGKWVEICCGPYEGFGTIIRDIRYYKDYPEHFQYLTNYGWINEDMLVNIG